MNLREKLNAIQRPIFEHAELDIPKIKRTTIDGVRYYKIPDTEKELTFISVTSVTSNYNKEKIAEWRKRVGEDEANRVTKFATTLGTQYHALSEAFFKNEEIPEKSALAKILFKNAIPTFKKIGKIYTIENPLYSLLWELAGTPDMIADYEGVLSVIDHKTSKEPKPVEWIEGYFVQCFTYALMYAELFGIMPKQLVIIMSCQNGEVKVYIEKDLQKYVKILRKYINKFISDKNESNR
jgi:CRISPR/Cas system-associated exonuclease Cas4 (RecB family)